MGYKEEFEGENTLITVHDDRDDIINIYTVKAELHMKIPIFWWWKKRQ